MGDNLADQLDTLLANHRLAMAETMDRIERLDRVLLDADVHVVRQLERIVVAHDQRREDAIALLQGLHARMMQGPRIPPIEERYAPLPSMPGHQAMLEAVNESFQKVGW